MIARLFKKKGSNKSRNSADDKDKDQNAGIVAVGGSQGTSSSIEGRSHKLTADDFKILAIIGRGGFGEVRLVREKDEHGDGNGKLLAMKVMDKREMKNKNQLNHLMSERNILAKTKKSEHVVAIHSSFQDAKKLYLVMEYLPGGDLMEMLIKRKHFKEHEVKFYMAELGLAVDAVHQSGYVHRDLKPDNILLDERGHIRLTDFGLCGEFVVNKRHSLFPATNRHRSVASKTKSVVMSTAIKEGDGEEEDNDLERESTFDMLDHPDQVLRTAPSDQEVEAERKSASVHFQQYLALPAEKKRNMLISCVGTPEYMAPEVLELGTNKSATASKKADGYGPECDYWSMGVIMFEFLYGHRPFWADTRAEMVRQVLYFEKYFVFPNEVYSGYQDVSADATDLMRKLLARNKDRIKDIATIKAHPFFKGIDFAHIRDAPGVVVPTIEHELDLQNFPPIAPETGRPKDDRNSLINFDGYTFRADQATEVAAQEKKEKDRKASGILGQAFFKEDEENAEEV